VFDPATRRAKSIVLGKGEGVANSISTAPDGTAVATDHALYLLTAGASGAPRVVWRHAYDRGPARKPGQLSWGTGATPVFFGPRNGTDYVTITDNAVPKEHLLVYRSSSGTLVCSVPATSGTENAPVASGNSVFVASTYGYHYPALPPNAGPSQPASAPFAGGITRIDVVKGGCRVRWTDSVRSAAVPRLSLGDGGLYTINRILAPGSDGSNGPSYLDSFDYAVVDAATGRMRSEQEIGVGAAFDSLQTDALITPGRIMYQGTLTGLFRIS
jgi:hypothetical protein